MRWRRLGIVVILVALLLLVFVGTTAEQVLSQGDTRIVLASVPGQGQAPSVSMLEATRGILVQRLGAVRLLLTQPARVHVVRMGQEWRLVVDVYLARGTTPSQVLFNLLGQVPQMVRERRWSLHLSIDNARQSRLQEVTSLLRQGQLSILANGSTFLAEGSPAARFPILASSKDIVPGSIAVAPDAVGAPSVVFRLRRTTALTVAQYTSTHVGAYMALVLDHTVIDCPVIEGPIATGMLQLVRIGTAGQAQALATLLTYGPTPTQLRIVSMP